MSARKKPEAEPETILTSVKSRHSKASTQHAPRRASNVGSVPPYLLQIAMLGGYLARKHDPPPGNMVVWRGLNRLNDIAFGISIEARRRCG